MSNENGVVNVPGEKPKVIIDINDAGTVLEIRERMVKTAKMLIEHNIPLFLRDLAKSASEDPDGMGELTIQLPFKMSTKGRKFFIDPSIEWKVMKKTRDVAAYITINPDQPNLPGVK